MNWLMASLTILVFLLAGCAGDLPYAFSIDPSTAKGCAISLNQVVEQTLDDTVRKSQTETRWSIRSVQARFEELLGERVQTLKCAKSGDTLVEPVEKVASKWLVTYSFEPANADHSFDRFMEFLLSMKVVTTVTSVTKDPVQADIKRDVDPLFEASKDKVAQWFGEREGEVREECPSCATFAQGISEYVPQTLKQQTVQPVQAPTGQAGCAQCALYKIVTVPPDLYPHTQEGVLLGLAKTIVGNKDRTHRIVVVGYEIPWDEDQTLIRYGITYYFEDWDNPAGPDGHATRYLGYDLSYANEATPRPYEPAPGNKKNDRIIEEHTRLWNRTGYPISVVIGLKNAAFEVAKMPFSLVAGTLFGRDNALNYPLQNIRTAYDALRFELTTEPRQGIVLGMYRLITEIPLVGHLLQYNFGAEAPEGVRSNKETPPRRKVFLSRGIYGGNKWGQDTGLWAATAHQNYPGYDVYSPPYRHGTVADVVWSMFNLSHGPAYSEALYIKENAGTADRLYLAGHSGGVQRSAAASRILWHHGYSVKKVVGIAGPSVGQAFVDSRYPDAFKVYLNNQAGANQDVVSQVGTVAQTFSSVVNFFLHIPLQYVPGALCPTFIKGLENCRDKIDTYMGRVGATNAAVFEVERKPSSLHNTPLRQSLTERIVFDAFVRSEFATAFRPDLESPSASDGGQKNDHPFSWER